MQTNRRTLWPYHRVEFDAETDTIIFVTEWHDGGKCIEADFERVELAAANCEQLTEALEYLWPDIWEELDVDFENLHDMREYVRQAG